MVDNVVNEVDHLNHLTSYNNLLQTSCDSDSCEWTQHHQNYRSGLTNITDAVFKFFQNLGKKVVSMGTEERIAFYGNLFESFEGADKDIVASLLKALLQSQKEAALPQKIFEGFILSKCAEGLECTRQKRRGV